jgi:hypothetical protein
MGHTHLWRDKPIKPAQQFDLFHGRKTGYACAASSRNLV